MKPHTLIALATLGTTTLFAGCAGAAKSPTPAAKPDKIQPSQQLQKTSNKVPLKNIPLQHTSAKLNVPAGFRVDVFASGLSQPRRLLIVPGGSAKRYQVMVSESKAGRVSILQSDGNGKASKKSTFAQGLDRPFGLAIHNHQLYVGNSNGIVRFPWKRGQTEAQGAPQKVLSLPRGGHWTRNILFNRAGTKMYIAMGSSCNVCEEKDPHRAAISTANPDGSNYQIFASGLRNPVGIALYPGTNKLWAVANERDRLGDDIPPDYLTLVQKGHFYGWPYAYTGIKGKIHPDPNFGDKNPQKVKDTTPPTVPVQAHSAPLGLAFYPLKGGKKYFPKNYYGDAFIGFHGSWNRSERTGYKIVRVHFEHGKPTWVSDFVTGFLPEHGRVWGRPVDVAVAPDGSLLFSDDKAGKIWRVYYKGK